jgi:hypothetical protein
MGTQHGTSAGGDPSSVTCVPRPLGRRQRLHLRAVPSLRPKQCDTAPLEWRVPKGKLPGYDRGLNMRKLVTALGLIAPSSCLVMLLFAACSGTGGSANPPLVAGSGGTRGTGGRGGTQREPDAGAQAGQPGTGGSAGDASEGGASGAGAVDGSMDDPDASPAGPDGGASLPDAGGPAADAGGGTPKPAGKLIIDGLTGDVTAREVDTFLAVVSAAAIPTSQFPNGGHNNLADGNGGTTLEAINRVYEITGEIPALAAQHAKLLDLAIRWSDAWFIHRNDLAQGEKRVMWTGKVEPLWPPDAPPNNSAGCEVGETVGILAYTALNIFKTKAIAAETVPDGDPNGYGATYGARGKTYLSMLEFSMDGFFNVNFLDKTTLTIRHPNSAAYDAFPANNVNAWNREMMFLHAWQTLGEIHALLGDDAGKAKMYRSITENAVNLFVQNAVPATAPDGTAVYNWGYGNFGDVTNKLTGEQIGIHAQYDIWGLTRAYRAGYTNATAQQMKTFADTVVHELTLPTGEYAGHIDRCCDTQTYNYLPSGFIFLVPFNNAIFKHAAELDINSGRQGTNPGLTAGLLWAKHVLAKSP